MTIEAKYTALGIPLSSKELFPTGRETFLKLHREAMDENDRVPVSTFQVLSENKIAVFKYIADIPTHRILGKSEPIFLTYDEINKADLKMSGCLVKGKIVWKPRFE